MTDKDTNNVEQSVASDRSPRSAQAREKESRRTPWKQPSALDAPPGVGPNTREHLLKKFKSFKRIKAAQQKDLIALLGTKKGSALFAALRQLEQES